MKEGNLMRRLMLALSGKATIFRNNVGIGWTGRIVRNRDGSITIYEPRPLHAGLCEGSSDLIGWTSRTVMPEMVGKKIAIFTAVEVKTTTGRTSEAQRNFLQAIETAGGIAVVARGETDLSAFQ
jgi:hypothetical protein